MRLWQLALAYQPCLRAVERLFKFPRAWVRSVERLPGMISPTVDGVMLALLLSVRSTVTVLLSTLPLQLPVDCGVTQLIKRISTHFSVDTCPESCTWYPGQRVVPKRMALV
jgi:hypothetical protein